MTVNYTQADLQKALKAIQETKDVRERAEQDLLRLQITNAEYLAKLQLDQINRVERARLEREQRINTRLIQMGRDAALVVARNEVEIKAAMDKEIQALEGKVSSRQIKAIENKYKKEIEFYKKNQKEIDKLQAEKAKEREKENKKAAAAAAGVAKQALDSTGGLFGIGNKKYAQEQTREWLTKNTDLEGAALDKAVGDAIRNARLLEAFGALADFAKQLKGIVQEIGDAKTVIDTRLQGSSNNKGIFGSAWSTFEKDIVQNIGLNPFVKQADVLNNLKSLVGQGVSFNVEQRAFLQTISDKIATTFNATDATLLKLVRIQQQDTTAARLGMESALTAFLNSMYETTEYMQNAASEIRQNIYEASALMGATQGVAFEYQVQKWLGSLYSVGFSSTSGLSSALGKLAAGDISGVTQGGMGNLLIMAANRANLSIAEILATGLDESDTNRLMQAMVEYLGDIYAETRNSRVVAQQYAGVFGLTASDLKAAANLYGSTTDIGKSTLNYGGMISRLQGMAGSMGSRMSIGGIMNNLIDNLKYTIAGSMANNPVLYATYTIAEMLDSAAGGLPINLPTYLGTGLPQSIKVSDIMRVASMSGGLLQGLGTMFAGLGKSGGMFNMLGAYGIGNNIVTLSRGNGTGIAAISGLSTSESGYIGNSESGDVQNKMLSDTKEDMNNQVAEASEESTETKLSTVDEHVVQIYELLNDVVFGSKSLKVDMGDVNAWSNIMGGRL